jgi:hypothetical protein
VVEATDKTVQAAATLPSLSKASLLDTEPELVIFPLMITTLPKKLSDFKPLFGSVLFVSGGYE